MCRIPPLAPCTIQPPKRLLKALAITLATLTAPLFADPGDQVFKFLSDDGISFDYFGNAIAIDQGIIAIGSYGSDGKGTNAGAAYLFNAVTGKELFKLTADDAAEGDFFGASIAISNGIVAVGAIWDEDNGLRSGSVYLFDAATGDQLSKLTPEDGAEGDEFGHAIAIHDGIVVVGAYLDSDKGDAFGSAYLFDANEGTQIAKLVPTDPAPDDRFGFSVAIHNGIVVVGAYQDDDNGADSGSAYLFDAQTGTQIAKLLPNEGMEGDFFGYSVAINNNLVLVGAFGDDETAPNSGAAYLFDASSGLQTAKLIPDDGEAEDHFGFALDIDFGLVAISAIWDDDSGFDAGSVYVFDGFAHEQLAKLIPADGEPRDHFGHAVAVDKGFVAIAAWEDDDNGLDAGSAYLFDADFTLKCLQLNINRLLAGATSVFTITGGTPGTRGVTVYGTSPGLVTLKNVAGYCAAFGIKGVNQSRVVGGLNRTFDEEGTITFNLFIPIEFPGLEVLFQTAQQNTCPDQCISNLFEAVIQ